MTTNYHLQRVGRDKVLILQPGYPKAVFTLDEINVMVNFAKPRRKQALERAAVMFGSRKKNLLDRLKGWFS